MTDYTGINHLALVTGDLDATIRFWRDLLGMRLVAGIGEPGYRHYFFEISEHDLVAFFEWPGIEPMEERDHGAPQRGPVGFDHVSIGVAERDDLWRLKDRLEAAGFWVSEAVDHGFIHSIYTFDPNHVPLEFSYALPEHDVRRAPVMGDSAPSAIAAAGSEPQPGAWPEVTKPTPPEARRVYPGAGARFWPGPPSASTGD